MRAGATSRPEALGWAASYLALIALASGATAAPLIHVSPEEVGFSSARLARVDEFYNNAVATGEIPGAVVLIARSGKVLYERAVGYADRATGTPMATDTVFWIASMTKPVTSVAVMTLVENGRLNLEDKIETYIPELKNLTVGVESTDSASGKRSLTLIAAERQPTVQDLLRHTSGFVYGGLGPTLVHKAYVDAHVLDNSITSAEMVTRLSKLPLAHQPGSTFEYSLSIDVLGRLIEVISGMPLDRYIEEHVAQPLGLQSLKFHVDPGRHWAWSAIAASFFFKDVDARTAVRANPTFLSGGGGMYCAAEDYARFALMLLNGGEYGGIRILAPKTVALMTHNHLGPAVTVPDYMRSLLLDIAPTSEMGQGFGLGFAVRTDEGRNPLPGSAGDFYWAGAGGTYFWIDPREHLVVVAMLAVANPELERKYRQYSRQLIYQAMSRSKYVGAE